MTEITFLSGGTGTPKLLDGARKVINEKNISIIVNTADDVEISGNLVCPDIDSVLYIFADKIDKKRWWGVKEDTYKTHNVLIGEGEKTERINSNREISKNRAFSGQGEFMMIGDKDRATHILRTSLIDQGYSLTEATKKISRNMEVQADILPMSNDPISTYIETPKVKMHFQEYWIANKCSPKVENIFFKGIDEGEPTSEVIEALKSPVIIGPSNPITSIGPILKLDDKIKKYLKRTIVVAVSPFIGGETVSGPAEELMEVKGVEPTSKGVYSIYKDFLDFLIVDGEKVDVGCEVIDYNTLMKDQKDSISLFKKINELIK